MIKNRQEKQKEAELLEKEEAEEQQRLEEELERKRQEKILEETKQREIKKQKEKDRIQRQRADGSYLTKNQQKARERACVQYEAAGIQLPERHLTSSLISNDNQPIGKRIVYDDRRKSVKRNIKCMYVLQSVHF